MCSVCLFRQLILDYGMWDQIRVDHGTEWALMLHVQSQLSRYRNDISKPPYVQTSSKKVCNYASYELADTHFLSLK